MVYQAIHIRDQLFIDSTQNRATKLWQNGVGVSRVPALRNISVFVVAEQICATGNLLHNILLLGW